MATKPEIAFGFAAEVEGLKKALHLAIGNELAKFQRSTGSTPSNVSIQMVEITNISSSVKEFTLGGVTIEFNF